MKEKKDVNLWLIIFFAVCLQIFKLYVNGKFIASDSGESKWNVADVANFCTAEQDPVYTIKAVVTGTNFPLFLTQHWTNIRTNTAVTNRSTFLCIDEFVNLILTNLRISDNFVYLFPSFTMISARKLKSMADWVKSEYS